MVTTNQKPTKDTQKLEIKEHKHATIENHQTTGQKQKEEKNTEELQKQTRKQVVKWQ